MAAEAAPNPAAAWRKEVKYLPDELGNFAHPVHYDIHLLVPDIDGDISVFEGYVAIAIHVTQETDIVALHADPAYINIRFAAVLLPELSGRYEWVTIPHDRRCHGFGVEGHVAEFRLPNKLAKDDLIVLFLLYEGLFSSTSRGFYELTTHWEPHNSTNGSQDSGLAVPRARPRVKVLRTFATSLEPLFSRRMFPCFDSPHHKARFTVSVSIPQQRQDQPELPLVNVISSGSLLTKVISEVPPLSPSAQHFLKVFLDGEPCPVEGVGASNVPRDFPSAAEFSSRLPPLRHPQSFRRKRPPPYGCCNHQRGWFSRLACGQKRALAKQKRTSMASLRQDDAGASAMEGADPSAQPATHHAMEQGESSAVFLADNPSMLDDVCLGERRFGHHCPSVLELMFPCLTSASHPTQSNHRSPSFSSDGASAPKEESCKSQPIQSSPRHTPTHRDRSPQRFQTPNAENGEPFMQKPLSQPLLHQSFLTFSFSETPLLPCYALGVFVSRFVGRSLASSTGCQGGQGQPLPQAATHATKFESCSPVGNIEGNAEGNSCGHSSASRYSEGSTKAEPGMNSVVHAVGNITITAWCLPTQPAEDSLFALWMAEACLVFLSTIWCCLPYPISKMDLIPLPSHRGLGLENFGSVSFDDRYFFVNKRTRKSRVFRIARLVCHEISHMWVGNLLSPASFDELWLKEGFARYIEYCVLACVFPSPIHSLKVSADASLLPPPIPKLIVDQLQVDDNRQLLFTPSDIWGCFVMDVYWDAIATDSADTETPRREFRRDISKQILSAVALSRPSFPLAVHRPLLKAAAPDEPNKSTKIGAACQTIQPGGPDRGDTVSDTLDEGSTSPCITNYLNGLEMLHKAGNSDLATHPVLLAGLLKTEQVVENFDSITYGKGACILHCLSSLIGKREGFLHLVERLLTEKFPPRMAPPGNEFHRLTPEGRLQGIFTTQDVWQLMTKVQQFSQPFEGWRFPVERSSDDSSRTAIGDADAFNPIAEFFDVWVQKVGFPRIDVRLSRLRSFPVPGSIQYSLSVVLSLTTLSKNQFPSSQQWMVPLMVDVNGDQQAVLLQGEQVIVSFAWESAQKEDSSDPPPIALRINSMVSTFCTIHPKNDLIWEALLEGVRGPSDQDDDTNIAFVLCTIIEDGSFRCGLYCQSDNLARSASSHRGQLRSTLELLHKLLVVVHGRVSDSIQEPSVSSLIPSLEPPSNVDSKPASGGVASSTQFPLSYTCLSVLHVILMVFDNCQRLATHVPSDDRILQSILSKCHEWLSEPLLPNTVADRYADWLLEDQGYQFVQWPTDSLSESTGGSGLVCGGSFYRLLREARVASINCLNHAWSVCLGLLARSLDHRLPAVFQNWQVLNG